MAGLIASELLNWRVIECIKNDSMRSIEDISEEIWQTIIEK